MRSPPADLVLQNVGRTLADGWQLRPASMGYLPEGGGAYHWVLAGADGLRHFITVDHLDGKESPGGGSRA